MNFETVPEFEKDIIRLEKKYPSIKDDLERAKKVLEIRPHRMPGAVRVSYREVKIRSDVKVYKLRRFYCKSLRKGGLKSGIRIIYGAFLSKPKITLGEIYREEKKKNDCDLQRLKRYFGV